MRLLRADTEDLELEDIPDGSKKYAILSHRWLPAAEEVTYKDLVSGPGNDNLREKAGWNKLIWCRQQAVLDGLQYVWADTACIDKSSSQELTESINAMYRWYQGAECCYVYLHDMPDPLPIPLIAEQEPEGCSEIESVHGKSNVSQFKELSMATDRSQLASPSTELTPLLQHRIEATQSRPGPSMMQDEELSQLESSIGEPEGSSCWTSPTQASYQLSRILDKWDAEAFAKSEWFTRAWTLQEMIAPSALRFYNKSWTLIGGLLDLAADVAHVTGIHEKLLTKERSLKSYSIAQKMSWAAMRRSTKIEDRAVSTKVLHQALTEPQIGV